MIKESGKRAVWEHAKETGLADGIALIAKYFDIKDVSIIGNGKITYIEELPRKCHRVPAVPGLEYYREEGKRIMKEFKESQKNGKTTRLKR
ncbi:hypothetical protein bas12_0038 [Escherichia phage BrunoManser]|uniref:Uncharacterized protein n=1 Tax=Escherichia phage BrunoManser TaxID=2851976 RepID=A0AAE7VPT8_9CAUD|nr:hypothetical protein bas12_0038 [Escherichia phage BrunoManser]